MEEAEKATFVVIMDKGNIIATGTPTELRNRYSGDYVIIHQRGNKETDDLLTSLNRKYTYNRDGHYYRVVVKDSADAIDFINSNRNLMSDFEVEKGNMDDVFLNVTGVKELLEEGLSK
jgi:multidrug/hemolysin transport system ATP-binding protein